MKSTALIPRTKAELAGGLDRIKSLVLDAVSSPITRQMYGRALDDFLGWWRDQGKPPFTKATVQRYRAALEAQDLAPATVNQKLSAIRKLADEAADNGLLDVAAAQAIRKVRGVRMHGTRTGNWLTRDQATSLIKAPDVSTLKGKRDRAILSVMIGCGLRREEVARLDFDHVQQREGRWAVVDLVGKHARVRTVPMPAWAKGAIDQWAQAASIAEGRVFRAVNKGDRVSGEALSAKGVFRVAREHAQAIGVEITPHDLRRTYAKLAHKGGAALEQIQLSLGHASMTTTERYLGVQQDLTDAPCDYIKLDLRARA